MPSPLPASPSPAAVGVLDLAPVVPVVVVADVADAVPLARALVGGGLPAIEVTLRTPAALFFPAQASGGTARLRSPAGPLPQARFFPTGGIGPANAPEYLALPDVGCVGGIWMVPQDAIAAGDWARIEGLAREAAALRR
ncbi:hypothetical protein [Streptomyces sp. NPDC007264]|uniref:hypothetical protein n=1 Tax=Streptomyces sp. NPDC007264 TaxID=3364777 RepID=UPI0036DAC868